MIWPTSLPILVIWQTGGFGLHGADTLTFTVIGTRRPLTGIVDGLADFADDWSRICHRDTRRACARIARASLTLHAIAVVPIGKPDPARVHTALPTPGQLSDTVGDTVGLIATVALLGEVHCTVFAAGHVIVGGCLSSTKISLWHDDTGTGTAGEVFGEAAAGVTRRLAMVIGGSPVFPSGPCAVGYATVSEGVAEGLFGSEEPLSISANVIVATHLLGSVTRIGAVLGCHFTTRAT